MIEINGGKQEVSYSRILDIHMRFLKVSLLVSPGFNCESSSIFIYLCHSNSLEINQTKSAYCQP